MPNSGPRAATITDTTGSASDSTPTTATLPNDAHPLTPTTDTTTTTTDAIVTTAVDAKSGAEETAMAVEPPELDDFGLPIRKYRPPPPGADAATTGPEAKDAADGANDQDTTKSTVIPNGTGSKMAETKVVSNEDAESSSDDEFKDAVSGLQSDAVSRIGSDGKEPSTPTVPNNGATVPEPKEKITEKPQEVTEKPKEVTEKPKADVPDVHREAVKVKDAEPTPKPDPSEAPKALETKAEPPKEEDQAISLTKESPKQPKVDHSRDKSEASIIHGPGVSEFSHQQLSTKQPDEEDNDDGEWQTMPAYAPYDIYDDDNKLIAKEYHEEEDQEAQKYGYGGLGGAGKGYTRVFVDDDAESATSMDENTQYLFKDKGPTTAVTDEDEVQRDAVSQLQATKELLTEGQRIAYVGLVRLEISSMVKDIETMQALKKVKKELALAAESMQMWGQKIMIRLYSHMDVSPAEQVMIEQLTAHGVMPADLTPILMANARVKNPMAAEKVKSPSGSDGSTKSPRPSSVASVEPEQPATPPPAYHVDDDSELTAPVKMPSQMPTTEKIDIDLRWTVLCDLFLVLIADSVYDSRSRVLLERVGNDLQIPWLDICRFEKKATDALEMQQQADKENWNEDDHMENRRKLALKRRYVMMGLATVGGGLVIGLSAGLLAPMIGAGLAVGFGAIGVSGTGTFLAGAGGAAIITSSAAASGGFIGVRAANRRTGAVKTFEYRPLHNNKRVNLIVTVSGWMTGKVDDVRLPFSTVDPVMGDLYSVLWEPDMLKSMGDTINILATEALTTGLQQVLGATVLFSLMAALQVPVVLTKLSYLIDNPWAVSLDRAWSAGLILADSLIDRNLGTRPITLVGYSIGSRVIFSCLLELARKGAHGLVQNVYLFGSPVVVKQDDYIKARAVVSGRFVNGYHGNDWILGYLFRLTNGGIRRIAGLAPVEGVPGIENKDISEFVAGHMDYRRAIPRLLRECGWAIESDEFTEIEDPDPENHGERQRELINEIEEARKEALKEQKEGKTSRGAFSFFRKKKVDKQEWEVYEDSHKTGAGPGSGRTEDKEGNNHGVLFDVDAIRAEIAMEKTRGVEVDEEILQVREIKSTLPPMKLELTPGPPPKPLIRTPRDSLRETRSAEAVPYRSSVEVRSSGEYRPTAHSRQPSSAQTRKVSLGHVRQPSVGYISGERTPTFPASKAEVEGYRGGLGKGEEEEEGVQMVFDTAFEEPPKQQQNFGGGQGQGQGQGQGHSRQASVGGTSNPWADFDDDEFGKEKEISMTFA
ncbi:hypothetical protein QBC47DRAFT_340626 [Echria macrotheca]|uniref:DUF726-domain-containing protein n=1 Tax=Echria macrotheca TaxID=438768 RepID=A0AAJ0BI84_9PEZI|nr:hypothetical protein QBC47DRAFT_340626 [Echria macrotheca]